MTKARKWMVKEKLEEQPKASQFEMVEEKLPSLEKNQFLVKAEYISVDPYMWSFASEYRVPYQQFGFQVGKVVQSNNPDFPVDSHVVSHSGWCDYAIVDNVPDPMFNMKPYIPDIGNLSPSLAVGALGMPGMAAYLGFLEICQPNKGETVCVTSACGAVGQLVGQIARRKGCKVIGITGSDAKVKVLKGELRFDHAFNYKTEENIVKTLKTTAQNGIDCYFDNVGGSLSNKVFQCLSNKARVAICGAISTYGKEREPRKLTSAMSRVKIESFSFTQWDRQQQSQALKQIKQWIENGAVKTKETITNGFENLPNAFVGMLGGENIGKAVVKV